MKRLIAILAFASAFALVGAQASKSQIDSYVAQVKRQNRHSRPLVYADTTQAQQSKHWERFRSEKARAAAQERLQKKDGRVFGRNAAAIVRKGHIVEVVFTYYSESGDWNLVRDCFYRPNGKLAKTEESYGAFAPAECTATTDTYYDEHGVAFGRERHFYKLGTKSPIKPVEVYEPDEPVYKNARDLPFRWK